MLVLLLMLLDLIFRNVPAAIVTGTGLRKAWVAIEWAAMEELLQAFAIFGIQFNRAVGQNRSLVATFLAGFVIQLGHQRGEVIV